MTLNLSIVITLVVNMVLVVLSGAHGVQISACTVGFGQKQGSEKTCIFVA